jgi:hypothetical protein
LKKPFLKELTRHRSYVPGLKLYGYFWMLYSSSVEVTVIPLAFHEALRDWVIALQEQVICAGFEAVGYFMLYSSSVEVTVIPSDRNSLLTSPIPSL